MNAASRLPKAHADHAILRGAGTYREVGFTYGGGGGGGAEDGSAADAAAGADAPAAGRQPEAPQYAPRLDVPIPARLAGRLPRTEREQKVGWCGWWTKRGLHRALAAAHRARAQGGVVRSVDRRGRT